MLEAIIMIGTILFVASAPVAFGIGMYNSKHPEAERKMQKVFERQEKRNTIILIIYLLWTALGAWETIVKS